MIVDVGLSPFSFWSVLSGEDPEEEERRGRSLKKGSKTSVLLKVPWVKVWCDKDICKKRFNDFQDAK
ncbi:5194_t:CDS:2 [Diversispora eburnea]|uniref:5194_t:CDS:1 n=1 Tax=Diversispora eburnea TaxID=1213867 RepID=A0A9N9BN72_9GLOM|nr:5194_t:CDS:2 [Diversispora eburnea]